MGSDGEIRVLHVDDEPEFGDVAAMHLERVDGGIDVVSERDARAALGRLRSEPFDCVVSDHDMPNMNGLEFLKAVREEFPELPFILFTGKGNEEIASDAISAGVTEYLQKDVGTDQYAVLANRIRRAVGENRAKAALEESERQLSTLISNLPGMVYRARNEPEWPMEFVSDGVEELVGYAPETVESGEVTWGDLIEETETDHLWERVQTCLAADEPFEVTYKVETADGETRWLWERGRLVGTDDEGVELLEGFVTDITARKERERELEQTRQFTETLVDAIDDVFYLVSPDGELLRWNDTVLDVTGYSEEEIASMHALDLFPEAYHDVLLDRLEETAAEGHTTVELPIQTKDGELIPHEFRGSRIEDPYGEVLGVAGIARDVTDSKTRKRKLEQYETLVENVGDAMYVLDADGTIRMANDAMVDHLGYEREEIIGTEPTKFMPPEDVETGNDIIERLLSDPDRTWATFEMHTIDADGNRTVNEDKVAPLVDDDGEFVGSVGVIRDITERTERERELERYETIVEAVDDPVYTLDDDGVFTFVNEAIEPMTGYSPEELVGEHIGVVMTDEGLERGEQIIQDLLDDDDANSGTLEMDIVTRDGERIPSENNMALLPAPDGEFAGTAGVIRDIAERKEREERLAEFASVVSHDLRNPLNVVQGRLTLAEETGDIDHLGDAAGAADRMERLIEDLLSLARQGETVGTTEQVDLRTTAEQAWANVDTGGATLDCAATTTVEADPARLRELLENLFRNSVEHGADTGSETADLTVTVDTMADGASTAGFVVADDGRGIPPATREKIFERGYTSSNHGTGFGLAIVEDIATAHGWSVEATESATGGARFEFRTTPADR
ncbi:hybrid sensor histidine kinase/response regulator [Haloarcula pellucida]|uniref:histidine kinase n=1 Tax=Haloarcula pellucida TaxID=1427151 RepID=A0A830GPP7_9EURY|nr:PAS domain S-box protein [Halomicroarcula pellucida]MBX0348264.1 PAS domain S-box protein [Halomicroarcula pellucida]GGN97757.1 hypothetical protein GCM10009030_27330 [Halomicroarcula pellucida]